MNNLDGSELKLVVGESIPVMVCDQSCVRGRDRASVNMMKHISSWEGTAGRRDWPLFRLTGGTFAVHQPRHSALPSCAACPSALRGFLKTMQRSTKREQSLQKMKAVWCCAVHMRILKSVGGSAQHTGCAWRRLRRGALRSACDKQSTQLISVPNLHAGVVLTNNFTIVLI